MIYYLPRQLKAQITFATVLILNDSGRVLNSAKEEDTKSTKSLLNFPDKYISTALIGNALIVSTLIDVEVNTQYFSKTAVSDVIDWSTSARISSTKLEAEIGRFLPLPSLIQSCVHCQLHLV